VKRLIVNADDFGLTPGVNRAILEAHQRGIVTSATLMANGRSFQEAVKATPQVPKLAIGCHVDLIQLRPVSPPEQVPTLVVGSAFRPGFTRFASSAMRGRVSVDEIAAEAAAQIRKLQAAGIQVSHFDTHKHTHIFPPVLKSVLRGAKECGVRAVRNPFEPESTIPFRRLMARWGLLLRWTAVQSLRTLARDFRRTVEAAGLLTTDGAIGVALTGRMDQRSIGEALRRIPEGTWELVTHPGYTDPELASLSKLTASREEELRWLTSAETRRAIEVAGIELISYSDLKSS
jgi:hopanoid biosynthesis associated protein HpnK